jgi:chloramphenicol O-acetyltransferase type A
MYSLIRKEVLKIPVGLQVHHAVMDGFYMGLFYEKLQQFFNDCDWLNAV